jgi:hypothetical protein
MRNGLELGAAPYYERLKGGGHSIHKKRLMFFTIDNEKDSKGGRRWPINCQ